MTATLVFILRVGLAIVLYYFLWRVLQTINQELKHQGNSLSLQKGRVIHIIALMNSGKEYKYDFLQKEILIGRSLNCNISINDEALSASHARISYHHSQWWLDDLGSTNGTILHKNRISTPTVVIDGDQFECGNTTFFVQMESPKDNFMDNSIAESRGEND